MMRGKASIATRRVARRYEADEAFVLPSGSVELVFLLVFPPPDTVDLTLFPSREMLGGSEVDRIGRGVVRGEQSSEVQRHRPAMGSHQIVSQLAGTGNLPPLRAGAGTAREGAAAGHP